MIKIEKETSCSLKETQNEASNVPGSEMSMDNDLYILFSVSCKQWDLPSGVEESSTVLCRKDCYQCVAGTPVFQKWESWFPPGFLLAWIFDSAWKPSPDLRVLHSQLSLRGRLWQPLWRAKCASSNPLRTYDQQVGTHGGRKRPFDWCLYLLHKKRWHAHLGRLHKKHENNLIVLI